MNWSKAKTILIIALLFTDIFLFAFFIRDYTEETGREEKNLKSAVLYMEEAGIDCAFEPESKRRVLRTLVITISHSDAAKDYEIDGCPVVIWGTEDSYNLSIEKSDARITVYSPANALIKALPELKALGSKAIESAELVYYTDRTGLGSEGEDTALPYWKITSDKGILYYAAYNE